MITSTDGNVVMHGEEGEIAFEWYAITREIFRVLRARAGEEIALDLMFRCLRRAIKKEKIPVSKIMAAVAEMEPEVE